ncbi:hypothetical protein [Dactylosporangium sp. CA-139066]|uniref:hypothetical protein n=1 Tax=Dactylosporangium sp. CA-139066 TaxID=3239930 RepID=UPI003D8FB3BE
MSDLPPFETVRSEAYKLLGDAQDVLRFGAGDVRDHPTGHRAEALARARQHIAAAKEALNDAVAWWP